MAKARVNIEDVELFYDAIEEQIEQIGDVDSGLIAFENEALNKIAEEKDKLRGAMEAVADARKAGEQKEQEIQRDIDRVQAQLAVTPRYIPQVESGGEDSPPVIVMVPNPEYDRLVAELEKHQNRLEKVAELIAKLSELELQIQNEYNELCKAETDLVEAIDEMLSETSVWEEDAERARELLEEIIDVLNDYLSQSIRGYAGTSSTGSTSFSTGGTAIGAVPIVAKAPKQYKDDNGKVYRVGNELIKNGTYTINGYTYETDAQGRIISAEGKLKLKDKNRKRRTINDPMQSIGRGSEKEGDDKGHIIGDRFDGSNKLDNLFPQNSHLNRGKYNAFEKSLAQAISQGKAVFVKIDLLYGTNTNRPTQILAVTTINGRRRIEYFDNI